MGCSSPPEAPPGGVQRRLSGLWYGGGAGAALLQPLASVYGVLVGLRRLAYRAGWLRAQRVGRPVVVVGNLTVGGTGKTPLTVWLARELAGAGLRAGIVSRGYGGRSRGAPRPVHPGTDWHEVGDEPLILARRSGCPTMVGADRVAAARALAAQVDVILADDGLQHLRLARDCEIVVIDGMRGFGNGRLLPAGPLREPAARLLQADAVVVNGHSEPGGPAAGLARAPLGMALVAQEAVAIGGPAAARPLADFRGRRVHAVAGIGNPARFFALLRAHGLEICEHPFPDHYPLAPAQLQFGDEAPVLMTEKDAVKCASLADPRLWYVPVAAQLTADDARELLARVLAKVRGAAPQAKGGC